MLKFGLAPCMMGKVWDDPKPDDPRHSISLNPKHQSLVQYSEEIYRKQILPGLKLDNISEHLCTALQKTWHNETLTRRHTE